MLKEVHNQYSKYLCDKLLLAHSANYDIHTRMFVSHKYFGDTVLRRPSTAAPGSNCRSRPPLVTPQRLPSQPHGITAPWTVPHYTAWWQRHVCVRTTYPRLLPESVTAWTRTRDLLRWKCASEKWRNRWQNARTERAWLTENAGVVKCVRASEKNVKK